MADIFVSYAREDEPRARQLALVLGSFGWSVWWDRHIPHGKDFADYIEEQLQLARCIVVLWSKNSLTSRFVRDEAAEGLEGSKLVPCLLEPVKPPLGFRQIQAANLTDWTGAPSHDEFVRFVESIAAVVPKPRSTKIGPRELVPFTSDVFISYSHRDNEPDVHACRWVSELTRALKARLSHLIARDVVMVMNPWAKDADASSDLHVAKLRDVGAFVAVVSPNYVNSRNALRDLAEFWKAAEERQRGVIGRDVRLFKVLKTVVRTDELPHALRLTPGYEFYREDANSGVISHLEAGVSDRNFWFRLDELAHDIAFALTGPQDTNLNA